MDDPLRIYSSLIEFDDKTAYNSYNKLISYSVEKNRSGKKDK
jgi:hypothetical protein